MLEQSRQRILDMLDERDLVLDVGGWGKPFPRADWVIDLQPYETRGLYDYDREQARNERFSLETWIVRDICDREPWPFENDQFDFVVCSHTLEDIRDPVWVCSELSRVGRAGYVEVPSRLEEQGLGIQGDWVGWDHHRWLCDLNAQGIEFVFKADYIHANRDCQLRGRFVLERPLSERRLTLWWEESVSAHERVIMSTEEQHEYLTSFVRSVVARKGSSARVRTPLRALLSSP
jgi:methyltransferase family protein